MRKFALVLLVVAFPAVAQAKPGRAPVTRTLVESGSWAKASNWSPQGTPALGDPVVIPVGKEAVVKAPAQSGPVTVEGRLAGPSPLRVEGSITVTHETTGAEWDLDGNLTIVGFSEIKMGGEEIYYLTNTGFIRLGGPLTVRESVGSPEGTIIQTEGFPLTVGYSLYPEPNTVTQFGNSVVTMDVWLTHPPKWLQMDSEHATFIISGAGQGLFRGSEWAYGNVTLEGNEPTSRTPYKVDGLLSLNQTTSGPILLEGDTTIEAGGLASNATAEHPVRVEATGGPLGEPRGEATIICGCLVPANVELVRVKVL